MTASMFDSQSGKTYALWPRLNIQHDQGPQNKTALRCQIECCGLPVLTCETERQIFYIWIDYHLLMQTVGLDIDGFDQRAFVPYDKLHHVVHKHYPYGTTTSHNIRTQEMILMSRARADKFTSHRFFSESRILSSRRRPGNSRFCGDRSDVCGRRPSHVSVGRYGRPSLPSI
jgi:hypothetical protein